MHLNNEPLCRMCRVRGRLTPAVMVDHIIPIRVRPDLRLDDDNLESLCRDCHDVKTEADRAKYGDINGRA